MDILKSTALLINPEIFWSLEILSEKPARGSMGQQQAILYFHSWETGSHCHCELSESMRIQKENPLLIAAAQCKVMLGCCCLRQATLALSSSWNLKPPKKIPICKISHFKPPNKLPICKVPYSKPPKKLPICKVASGSSQIGLESSFSLHF